MGRKRPHSNNYNSGSDEEIAYWRRDHESNGSNSGGYSSRKRHRDSISRADKLELLIYKLAERGIGNIESDIERLAEVLLADMSEYQGKIIELLQFCVCSVPERITIYSTLVGVMNARNSSFGSMFLQNLWTQLHRCLSRGQFDSVECMVRFICDLINSKVITEDSLLNFLGALLNAATESTSAAAGERRSDFFVYIVLSSLPWCGKQLFECKPHALNQLLNTIYHYVYDDKRQKLHLSLLQVWSSQDPHPQEDYLECLVEQLKHLVEDEWIESQIVRPYRAFDSILCEATSHQFPQLELLTADEEESNELVYPLPKVIFRMFDYTDVPDDFVLPGSHSIERYLIEDQINKIISTYHLERKTCAGYLLDHKVLSSIPLDYIIVEVIFGQLFTLPNPPHIELLYGALLIELCKMKPESIPQVLAQATELIFDRMSTMKAICIERYVNWFSYNLSNFQLRWSWDYWSYVFEPNQETTDSINECATLYDKEIKLHFIREVMQKLIRFTYHSALVQTTPVCFHPYIPPRMTPGYKYGARPEPIDRTKIETVVEDDEDNSVTVVRSSDEQQQDAVDFARLQSCRALAMRLRSAMQDKATPQELQQLLQHGSDLESAEVIDVLVSTMLYLASKTFSHTYAALVRYHSLLRTLVGEDEHSQIALLNSTFAVWSSHQQIVVFIVDKMLRAQLVRCTSIAAWLFSNGMRDELVSVYVWEILHNTVKYECNRLTEHAAKADDEYDRQERLIKDMFLVVLQRMVSTISDYVNNFRNHSNQPVCDPFKTTWYKWMTERLQAFLLSFHDSIRPMMGALEALIFTPDVQSDLLDVFQQFCSIHI